MADARKANGSGTSASAVPPGTPPKVKWDDSNMRSSYANVCNVAGTREEIVLLFGMNQAWHAGQKEVTVQLSERIVLSPFAAKRLSLLLAAAVQDYERRFGSLNIEAAPRPAPKASQTETEH